MTAGWRLALIASLAANLGGAAFVAWRLATREAPPSSYRAEREGLFTAMTRPARIVMLGDSLTDRGEWHELLRAPDVINRGIAGDTIRGVTGRLGPVFAAKPEVIAVMVGINDLLGGRSVAACLTDYHALLAALRAGAPAARILVQSVLPTSGPMRGVADEVIALDTALRAACATGDCEYVDVHAVLALPDGTLDPAYTLDGVHLAGAGYVRWSEALAGEIAAPRGARPRP